MPSFTQGLRAHTPMMSVRHASRFMTKSALRACIETKTICEGALCGDAKAWEKAWEEVRIIRENTGWTDCRTQSGSFVKALSSSSKSDRGLALGPTPVAISAGALGASGECHDLRAKWSITASAPNLVNACRTSAGATLCRLAPPGHKGQPGAVLAENHKVEASSSSRRRVLAQRLFSCILAVIGSQEGLAALRSPPHSPQSILLALVQICLNLVQVLAAVWLPC